MQKAYFYIFETDDLLLNAIEVPEEEAGDSEFITDDPELIAALRELRELHQQLWNAHLRARKMLRKAGNEFGD